MKTILILLIRGYQRFVSPHKGYRCAHAASHGGSSCSHYFRETLDSQSVGQSLALLRSRLKACTRAADVRQEDDNGRVIIPCVPFI